MRRLRRRRILSRRPATTRCPRTGITGRPADSDTPHVLLVATPASYRTGAYLRAAKACGVRITLVSIEVSPTRLIQGAGIRVPAADPQAAARMVRTALSAPVDGVLVTDDAASVVAADIADALGLGFNSPTAARTARNKYLAREAMRQHGIATPWVRRIDLTQPLPAQLCGVPLPCVAKPTSLAASRGVIRADTPCELHHACRRIERLLQSEQAASSTELLVEAFIAGREYAIEGVLRAGELEILAIFDKPDSLDGPYFEETYYITPSRAPATTQRALRALLVHCCAALGLREGPLHAECRVNDAGVWALELAPRTIGGECARLFEFGTGLALEELVIRHAAGLPVHRRYFTGGVGVLMMPVPASGVLRRVEGVSAALAVAGIEDLVLNVREGHELVQWPEGGDYPGFIFARAASPAAAEAALRDAWEQLNWVVAPRLSVAIGDQQIKTARLHPG